MSIKTTTRTIRIHDHDAIPMDISIDFAGGSIDPVMFFEIEQDHSIVVSIDGLEALLAAAKQLREEYLK